MKSRVSEELSTREDEIKKIQSSRLCYKSEIIPNLKAEIKVQEKKVSEYNHSLLIASSGTAIKTQQLDMLLKTQTATGTVAGEIEALTNLLADIRTKKLIFSPTENPALIELNKENETIRAEKKGLAEKSNELVGKKQTLLDTIRTRESELRTATPSSIVLLDYLELICADELQLQEQIRQSQIQMVDIGTHTEQVRVPTSSTCFSSLFTATLMI